VSRRSEPTRNERYIASSHSVIRVRKGLKLSEVARPIWPSTGPASRHELKKKGLLPKGK